MNPNPIPVITESDAARFLSRVSIPNAAGCCEWLQERNQHGYGRIRISGRKFVAHRVSYTLFVGPIPEGAEIDHVCHNKSCVRPDHLRPVTHKQNGEHRAGAMVNSTSGVLGVHRDVDGTGRVRWRAQVTHLGSHRYFGKFDTIEQAAEAVVAGRRALFTHNDRDRAVAQVSA